VGTKSLTEHILVSLEGNVADEESVRLWVLRVTERLSTLIGTLLWCGVVTGSREVNVGLTTVNESTLLGLESGSGISRVGKLDVTEPLRASRVSVADNASTSDLTELFKLAEEPLIIDIPAQVTDKQVVGSSILSTGRGLGLSLLGWGNLCIICLALLGWGSLLLLRRVFRGVRVRVILSSLGCFGVLGVVRVGCLLSNS